MKKMFIKIKKIFNRSIEKKITFYELKNIMKSNNNILLIDVRSNQEYIEGHLAGAINVPVYNLANKIQNTVKNKSNIIILYCQSEIRSIKAKKILERMGYCNIYILKGGIEGV